MGKVGVRQGILGVGGRGRKGSGLTKKEGEEAKAALKEIQNKRKMMRFDRRSWKSSKMLRIEGIQ